MPDTGKPWGIHTNSPPTGATVKQGTTVVLNCREAQMEDRS